MVQLANWVFNVNHILVLLADLEIDFGFFGGVLLVLEVFGRLIGFLKLGILYANVHAHVRMLLTASYISMVFVWVGHHHK